MKEWLDAGLSSTTVTSSSTILWHSFVMGLSRSLSLGHTGSPALFLGCPSPCGTAHRFLWIFFRPVAYYECSRQGENEEQSSLRRSETRHDMWQVFACIGIFYGIIIALLYWTKQGPR